MSVARTQSRVTSSSTPSSRPTPATSVPVPPREHTTTAFSRIKHMFDTPRHTILEAHVRIDELANVPQLDGGFTTRWKFRARKTDKSLGNKPSLPNLKAHGAVPHSTLASASSTSLRSTPTVSSIAPITGRPTASPENSLLDSHSRAKALSLPPHNLSPVVSEDNQAGAPEKKTSDPTPLREVTTAPLRRTSSPDQMSPEDHDNEPPELKDAGEGEGERRMSDESAQSSKESRSASRAGSMGGMSAGSVPSTAASSRRGSLHPPSHGLGLPHALTTPASSSSPTLPKQFPKSLNAPARSGTSPSPAIILDQIPDRTAFVPEIRTPISRTVSQTTTSTSSAGTGISSIIPRNRIVSGPGAFGVHKKHDDLGYATSRKGTTPVQHLKSHTVAWHYDLRYIMRVPLVKQAGAGGVETPGRKTAGPMLGSGPLSESGIRLVFEQVPEDRGDKTPSGMTLDSPHNIPSKAQTHEKIEFGSVDIDLAPFAGKGLQTRRFLLQKSRTNAVVKLTIDVRLVGGETNFTTGMVDMMGDMGDRAKHDIRLERTGSNSSSSNSSLSHPSQASSAIDLSLPQTHSAVDLSRAPHMAYKSYEHHLKPTDALRPSPKRQTSMLSHFSLRPSSPGSTPRQSPSRQISSSQIPSSPELTLHTPPASPSTSRHATESPQTATAPDSPSHHGLHIFSGLHRHHRHHAHHLHPRRQDSVLGAANKREMLPEEVIEAVFNPRPSHERTPLTYKIEPKPATPTTDPEDNPGSFVILDHAADPEDKPRPSAPGRWDRLKQRTASHRHHREREPLGRVQSGISAA